MLHKQETNYKAGEQSNIKSQSTNKRTHKTKATRKEITDQIITDNIIMKNPNNKSLERQFKKGEFSSRCSSRLAIPKDWSLNSKSHVTLGL